MCPDKVGKQLGQRTSLQFRVLSSGVLSEKATLQILKKKKEQKFLHRKYYDKTTAFTLISKLNLMKMFGVFSSLFVCLHGLNTFSETEEQSSLEKKCM